jgi:SAM-dependent methyltransferase/predicted O-methyltransferase YrrM
MVRGKTGKAGTRAHAPRCWCGAAPTSPFSDDYLFCDACGTLVLRRPPGAEALRVRNDEQDFYGRSYYETHLTDRYKYPPLSERARRDIGGRCLHWLRALLKHRLPPATVLELGSAHGGFVGLMRQAGYKAAGLEMSPSVVRMARRAFGVPMLLGPLEDQALEPRSLDVVAMMDVIEHLPDPLGTLRRCLRLLRPDGLFLVQTPGYPDGKSLGELRQSGDRFIEQLKPAEHLFLFSERAIRALLERLKIAHVVFEPAIFAHYDMFFVASRRALVSNSQDMVEKALTATPAGRFALALMDLDDGRRQAAEEHGRRVGELEAERNYVASERDNLRRQFEFVEADRAARLQVIEEQGKRLGQVESERDAALAEQAGLRARLADMEAELASRAAALDMREQHLRVLEKERCTLRAEIDQLRQQLSAAAAESAERLAVVEQQSASIRQLETEQREITQALAESKNQVESQRVELNAIALRLAAVELDRSACLQRLSLQARQLADGAAELGELSKQRDRLRDRLEHTEQVLVEGRQAFEALERALFDSEAAAALVRDRVEKLAAWRDAVLSVLSALRRSRVLRAYRSVGGWKPMDEATAALIKTAPSDQVAGKPPAREGSVRPAETRRISWPELRPLPAAESAPSYAEAEQLAERLADFAGHPEYFRVWEQHGVHVTPVHFYSPIPVVSELDAAPWPGPRPLTGIDMREAQQLALLDGCREFESEYTAFADQATSSPHEYFRNQPMLRVVDAEVLHCLVRRSKPKRIIEVGSGFSTCLTAAALLKNAGEGHPAHFVAIEPHPNDVLRAGIPGLNELRVEPVQSLPAAFADDLDEHDMLFIDSSHVVRIDSDVRFLFLEVLPRLKPGVLVHVHDVFLPADYPRAWVVDEHRFWSEQYLLHALLLFSRAFEVVWAGSFMHMKHPDALARVFPAYDRQAAWPGSFWIRRVAEGEDSRP